MNTHPTSFPPNQSYFNQISPSPEVDLEGSGSLQPEDEQVAQVALAAFAGGDAEVTGSLAGAAYCGDTQCDSLAKAHGEGVENSSSNAIRRSSGSLSSSRELGNFKAAVPAISKEKTSEIEPLSPITCNKEYAAPSPSLTPSGKSMEKTWADIVVPDSARRGNRNVDFAVWASDNGILFTQLNAIVNEDRVALCKEISKFSLMETDPYTLTSFEELIQARKDVDMPYLLALIKTKGKSRSVSFSAVDGISFLRDHYRHGRDLHPLTRLPVTSFLIFKNTSRINEFKLFCTDVNIRLQNDRLAKMVNAFDPDLNPALRGRERFYLANRYRIKAEKIAVDSSGIVGELESACRANKVLKLLEKESFWLEKAVQDGHIMACINLGYLYLIESESDPVYLHTGLHYIRKAALEVREDDPRLEQVLRACMDVFTAHWPLCNQDVAFVQSRLQKYHSVSSSHPVKQDEQ